MKALEISEQEAIQREESYAEQIKECTTRLKEVTIHFYFRLRLDYYNLN